MKIAVGDDYRIVSLIEKESDNTITDSEKRELSVLREKYPVKHV